MERLFRRFCKLSIPSSRVRVRVCVQHNESSPAHLRGVRVRLTRSPRQDGEYVIITGSESTAPVNSVYWCKVADVLAHVAAGGGDEFPVNKMIDNFDAGYDYVTNEG